MAGVKGRSGGSNKLSVAEHQLNGTYRNARHSGIIQADPQLAQPEPYINGDFTANKQEIFQRFASILHEGGLTSGQVDSLIIGGMVDLQVAYLDLAQVYALEGVGSKTGGKLTITLMMEVQKELRALWGEYHLSPSTRAAKAREKDVNVVAVDPVADFLAKPIKK